MREIGEYIPADAQEWDDEPSDWCRECEEPIDSDEDDGSGLCPYCRNDP